MILKRVYILGGLLLMLTNCQTIGNWADSIGEHLPVIGERCEHWQCFTASGQQISEQNKKGAQAAQGTPQAVHQVPQENILPQSMPPPIKDTLPPVSESEDREQDDSTPR